jgi:hypothetical protein
MTSKEKTYNALNGAFLNTESNKINSAYLNELLCLNLANDRPLYDSMHNTRLKPESVAWQALTYEANTRLASEEYPAKYIATSDQLKKWLSEFGAGYDTIAETVEYIVAERLQRRTEI